MRTTRTTTTRRRPPPGLRLRGTVWHIQKHVRGYGPLCESTGEKELGRAEAYLTMRLDQLRRMMVYGERPDVTFAEAAAKYLQELAEAGKGTARADFALAHLLPAIGQVPLRLVHDGTLDDYRRARREAGAAAGTINKELGYVRRICTLAARVWRHPNGQPYLDTAPLLRMVDGPARAPYPATQEEQDRLLAALPAHLATMALFAVHTGLRDGELTGLQWAWEVKLPEPLGLPAFVLPGHATKNGEARVVLLNAVARRIIEAQRGKHPTTVFTFDGAPVTRMLNTAWRRAREKAGLPRLRVHDLRHTFATRLRALGVSLEDRKALMGHTTTDVTTHYSAPELRRLQAIVERLATSRPVTVLRAVTPMAGQNPATRPDMAAAKEAVTA